LSATPSATVSEPAGAEIGATTGRGPMTLLARHVIIPAAIIAMVASLLFYLLEVRAVFLSGGTGLKMVGFCFSAATVLIARYGRVSGEDADQGPGQGCYTVALAVATLLFMTIRSSAASFLPNLLILAAAWRFATGVTLALSLESELDPLDLADRSLELYGLERVRFEEFRRRQREENGAAWGTLWRVGRKAPDAHGNPVAAVARLAALALLGFALGEPWLLRAEPTLGERALADVIVFLFSTGLVLAAGSAAGTLRHTLRARGRVAPGVLPMRIGIAALLAVAVLAAALAIPGVKFQGHGRLRQADRSGPTGGGEGQSSGRHTGDAGQLGSAPPQRGRLTPSEAPPGPSLVNLLSGLGRLLRIPLLLGVLFLALLAVRRLGSLVPGWKELLARLRAWLRGRLPERKPRPAPVRDPFADLATLAALPPRDAVLAAYGRLLLALDQAGHRRPERNTPYEHVNALPRSLQPIATPVRTLTDLYVAVAYGDSAATEHDRDGAIAALEEVRGMSVAEGRDTIP
jgi:hypothetical protein